MKKITTALSLVNLFLLSALFFPFQAFAQKLNNDSNLSFDDLNPLVIENSTKREVFQTPASFLTQVLLYLFPIAGLILFVMIVWGGFEILSGASSSKSKDAGKQRVTAAIIGFLLLFASYWIVQVIQVVFNVNIINGASL